MDFHLIYANLTIPVIVVDFLEKHVIYMNSQAEIILDTNETGKAIMIYDVLKCKDINSIHIMMETINDTEMVQNYQMLIEEDVLLEITGNLINKSTLILYLREVTESERNLSYSTVFRSMFGAAFSLQDIDEILGLILKAAGLSAHISCSFILEEKKDCACHQYAHRWRSTDNNTQKCYCIDIDFSRSSFVSLLKKNDSIVINDINEIDAGDVEVFSCSRIKAIALFPLFVSHKYFGMIGFGDCQAARKWSNNDLLIFLDTANLVSEVFARKQMEQIIAGSQKVISNVLDNINTNIYVTDFETNELLFVNSHIIKELGITLPFEGKKCWELLHKNKLAQCDFCEKHLLFDVNGVYTGTRKRELMNEITGKWYYVEDSIIKWIDGRTAFLETSIEFGERKALEDELIYHASTDIMTQTFNRAWGLKLLNEAVALSKKENFPLTVCFIDVDGLKFVNDKYGHSKGDDLLLTIIHALKNNLAEQDILSRLGGDEFLIIFKNSTYDQSEIKIQCTLKELNDFNNSGEKPYTCSFCYGLDQIGHDNTMTVDEIISLVDAKMYEQKVLRRKSNF